MQSHTGVARRYLKPTDHMVRGQREVGGEAPQGVEVIEYVLLTGQREGKRGDCGEGPTDPALGKNKDMK